MSKYIKLTLTEYKELLEVLSKVERLTEEMREISLDVRMQKLRLKAKEAEDE
jgi:hypothetical protein